MGEPRLAKERLGEEDFTENFLPWYEVSGANGTRNRIPSHCYLGTSENRWFSRVSTSRVDAPNDARLVSLSEETENLDVIVDAGWISQEELCQGVSDGPAPCN